MPLKQAFQLSAQNLHDIAYIIFIQMPVLLHICLNEKNLKQSPLKVVTVFFIKCLQVPGNLPGLQILPQNFPKPGLSGCFLFLLFQILLRLGLMLQIPLTDFVQSGV